MTTHQLPPYNVALGTDFLRFPSSSLLFVLGIELFARALKAITALKIHKQRIKIVQCADDTIVFVRNMKSVPKLLNLLKEFGAISSLKINAVKSEVIWFGGSGEKSCHAFWWCPKDPVNS